MAQAGVTPLILASMGNHLDCVRFLLKSGADVNLRDEVRRLWRSYGAVALLSRSRPQLSRAYMFR